MFLAACCVGRAECYATLGLFLAGPHVVLAARFAGVAGCDVESGRSLASPDRVGYGQMHAGLLVGDNLVFLSAGFVGSAECHVNSGRFLACPDSAGLPESYLSL